jgi:hypothetical protein
MEVIMKKLFMVMVLLLSLLVVGAVYAEEGEGTGKGYYIGNLTILPFSKDTMQINYDVDGIGTNDSGKGLFHNCSQHVVGSLQVVKGDIIADSGFIITTLASGDKVFMTYKGSGTFAKDGKPSVVKGVTTYLSGTGKATGITGSSEFTRYTLQPPTKGRSATVSITKSHWKLP